MLASSSQMRHRHGLTLDSAPAPPGLQVDYDPDMTGPRAMLEAVDDAGFEAELITDRRYSTLSLCSFFFKPKQDRTQ